MEDSTNLPDLSSDDAKVAEMRSGANWFFWIAILALVSLFLFYYFDFANHLVGLGMSEYVDAKAAATGLESQRWGAIALGFGFAGIFAIFGYFARKGNDFAFILGMFVYVFDAVILLGYREIFAFGFHLFCLFFLFKGLLASRRRYDPSVDATGS
ncbi:MAG: hypothetical protein ACRD6X_17990 [Pyrinomonadaceae bacterium]